MSPTEHILQASSEWNTDIHFSQEIKAFNEIIKKLEQEYYISETASGSKVGKIEQFYKIIFLNVQTLETLTHTSKS